MALKAGTLPKGKSERKGSSLFDLLNWKEGERVRVRLFMFAAARAWGLVSLFRSV